MHDTFVVRVNDSKITINEMLTVSKQFYMLQYIAPSNRDLPDLLKNVPNTDPLQYMDPDKTLGINIRAWNARYFAMTVDELDTAKLKTVRDAMNEGDKHGFHHLGWMKRSEELGKTSTPTGGGEGSINVILIVLIIVCCVAICDGWCDLTIYIQPHICL